MAAVASYYANPTPSMYPHQYAKPRGHRVCDTCGAVELAGQRFRMCGGCMITQYCSQDCQKRHWPAHKTLCQHTSGMLESAKHDTVANAYSEENIAKNLRKFVSAHQMLLSWSAFQALQLRRVPANIRSLALHIDLQYRNHADPARRFVISSARLVQRSLVESYDPLVAQDIQRREERCRRSGGIGAAVILIQCGGMSQVMPVECDSPSRVPWDAREDWAEILAKYTEAGRVDFQPITTTSRGVIYG
ncbi:uncharacterized protein FOMMEDRAFT_17627 [Fomitiporia mediterranea MF3/22]|uniref:uncharacterized protein n=1 Tax=Fomitiporia mediterranea (strain MF3/22) TaxID=694068 RepID=UPI0004409BB5|nr:uncharacterized protein FOMMEDRAFT_17627 [Fomitiporia mediterranea MF3/22]EJD07162.1 hypothetical protein FOMMEDRAFT_17627 [Fomitiporia mediterranea MF3/22]